MNLDRILEGFLQRRLSATEIRTACQELWLGGGVACLSPRQRTAMAAADAGWRGSGSSNQGGFYGNFRTARLVGETEFAGAYATTAPAETRITTLLIHKNIPPHRHEDSKISIITQGRCSLFVHRQGVEPGSDHTLEIPLQPFEVVALPAGIGHTYDAGVRGFSQIVITDCLRLPDHPAYAQDVGSYLPDMDGLPRRLYSGTRPSTDQDL